MTPPRRSLGDRDADRAEQLAEGGLVLIDVKRGNNAGNLVLLHKHPDRLEGRFLPKLAGFMTIRDTDR
jgi:hypothetical protein